MQASLRLEITAFIVVLITSINISAQTVTSDTINYSSSPAGVTIGLDGSVGSGGDAQGDSWTTQNNLYGSDHNDSLTGNAQRNQISGRAGDDTLYGLEDNDELYGSEGNDFIHGGSGNDYINAGEGNDNIDAGAGNDNIITGPGADIIDGGTDTDFLNYYYSTQGIQVTLDSVNNTGGYAEGDSISNIENLGGSTHDDIITGNDNRNQINAHIGDDQIFALGGNDELYGREGNDSIHGGSGNDYINAGEGNDSIDAGADDDTIIEGAGADSIDGGEGTDAVNYYYSTEGVQIGLDNSIGSGGDAQGDTLINVENLYGSQHNDSLTGNTQRNQISGRAGDDTIYGLEGNDELYGYEGNDTIDGGSGNDYINAGEGNDTIDAGADNDTIVEGAGADSIDGGAGTDTVNYYYSSAGVTIGLDGSIGSGGDAQGDTLINVENLYGSQHNDNLTGSAQRDQISGRSGDDTIYGLEGNDELYGREGNDSIHGGSGNDYINAGEGNDTIDAGTGNDVLMGKAGNDTYQFNPNWGQDTINNDDDTGNHIDTIQFTGGILPNEICLNQEGVHLIITHCVNGDRIQVRYHYDNDYDDITQVTFDNGTVWDSTFLNNLGANDSDSDGVTDINDLCPNTPNAFVVDANGCAQNQLDDDNDGVINASDFCANTPAGETANSNGCSISQLDDDSDGIANGADQCAGTPAGQTVDNNGCAQIQLDTDGDGVNNAQDQCNNTPANEIANANGCSASQIDTDGDGVFDNVDAFINDPTETTDTDGDGVGDNADAYPNDPTRSEIATIPGVPTDVVSTVDNNTGEALIGWSIPDGSVTYYELEDINDITPIILQLGADNYTSQLLGDGYHTIRVRACNANNQCGDWSAARNLLVEQYALDSDSITDPVLPDSTYFGTLTGSHSVDASGNATYSVPIATSPGTAGVTPQLSINYNSAAGNGLLGQGWSLGGLSSITRCNKTLAQDGTVLAVNHTSSDAYCMDGQKLIEVAEKEYRTEIDSGNIITLSGPTANPTAFTVKTKAGETMTYGATADARLETLGHVDYTKSAPTTTAPASSWSLNRFEDAVGNYYTISYTSDLWGEQKPHQIQYTGNDIAGVLPYHTIIFHYSNTGRNDKRFSFNGGAISRLQTRLTAVQTPAGEYRLSYAATQHEAEVSRLENIKYCTLNGQCQAPLNFEWQQSDEGWQASTAYAPPANTHRWKEGYLRSNGVQYGDVNGDGLVDMLVSNSSTQKTYLNTGSGWDNGNNYQAPPVLFLDTSQSSLSRAEQGVRLADFNGDGRVDIVQSYIIPAYHDNTGNCDIDCPLIPADDERHIWLSEANGWQLLTGSFVNTVPFIEEHVQYGSGAVTDLGVRFIDIDADGDTDILYGSRWDQPNHAWRNDNLSWTYMESWKPPIPFVTTRGKDLGTVFMDVNHDGLADMIQGYTTQSCYAEIVEDNVVGTYSRKVCNDNPVKVWFNRLENGWERASTAFETTIPAFSRYEGYEVGVIDEGVRQADLNGDGKADIVQQNIPGFINKNGFEFGVDTRIADLPVTFIEGDEAKDLGARIVDLNGDGLADLMQHKTSHAPKAWLNTGSEWELSSAYNTPYPFTYEDNKATGLQILDVNGDGLSDLLVGADAVPSYTECTDNSVISYGSYQDTAFYNALSSADKTRYRAYLIPRINEWESPNFVIVHTAHDSNNNLLFKYIKGPGAEVLHDYKNSFPSKVIGASFIVTESTAYANNLGIDLSYDAVPDETGVYISYIEKLVPVQSNQYINNYNIIGEYDLGYVPGKTSYNYRLCEDFSFNVQRGAWLNKSKQLLINKITDGLGNSVEFSYKRLNDKQNPVYEKLSNGNANNVDAITATYAVSAVKINNGLDGYLTTSYQYEGLRLNRQRGLLGFAKVIQTSPQGIRQETHYHQAYPYTGRPSLVETYSHTNTKLSQAESFYCYEHIDGGIDSKTDANTATIDPALGCAEQYNDSNHNGSLFIYPYKTVQTTYQLDNFYNQILGAETTVTTETRYNQFQDVTDIKVTTTGDGQTFIKHTVNQYNPANLDYIWQGRLTRATVTSTAYGDTQTRISAFSYNQQGMLAKETIQPDGLPEHQLSTAHAYDVFGNKIATTSCASDAASCIAGDRTTGRTTTMQYDAQGRFPIWSEDIIGARTTFNEYDSTLGVLLQSTDVDGLITRWQYNDFAQQTQVTYNYTSNRQTITQNRMYHCNLGGCPTDIAAVYYSEAQSTAGSPVKMYYDQRGREIRKQTTSFDGRAVYTDTVYDELGRTLAVSEPSYTAPAYSNGTNCNSSIPGWTCSEFDNLNRVHTIYPADSRPETTTDYNGFTTITSRTVDGVYREQQKTVNAQGQTTQTVDAMGNTVTFGFDAVGNIKTTIVNNDPATEVIINYDLLGRKQDMDDPDKGYWTYQYNAYGELIQQTDAKGQVTVNEYDTYGRLHTRYDHHGTASQQANTWSYYPLTAVAGRRGKLQSTSNNIASTSYAYDSFGQTSEQTETIDGSSYTTSYQYDAAGRLYQTYYPEVGGQRLVVRQRYNNQGYLSHIQSPGGAVTYWQAEGHNARGQRTVESLGTGQLTVTRTYDDNNGQLNLIETSNSDLDVIQNLEYHYSDTGNLNWRDDHRQGGMRERFEYDILDRLISSEITNGINPTALYTPKTYSYNALGNLTSKSDIGAYTYNTCQAGPHAVCSAGSNHYTYDANGNMTHTNGQQSVWYTSFDKPARINRNGSDIHFQYNSGKRRVKQSHNSKTTHYIGINDGGSHYERISQAGQRDKHIHNLYGADSQPVAIITLETNSQNQIVMEGTQYTLRDHLGSVIGTMDTLGKQINYLSYDAWGQRRNSDWTDNPTQDFAENTANKRGYTGHEMLHSVGLIHMNGRVYDPVLGTFLSADSHVQAPQNSQNYNRYSYVQNNPLTYTDPSGYFFKRLFKSKTFIRGLAVTAFGVAGLAIPDKHKLQAVSIGITIASHGIINPFIAGAAAGFVGSGGDLKAALVSGGAAFFLGQIGLTTKVGSIENILANGVIGGIQSEALGGDFKDGFIASAFAALGKTITNGLWEHSRAFNPHRVVAAAIIGGTASKLSGGKFANGAVSAAFTQAFNGNSHILESSDEPQVGCGINMSCIDETPLPIANSEPPNLLQKVTDALVSNMFAGVGEGDYTATTVAAGAGVGSVIRHGVKSGWIRFGPHDKTGGFSIGIGKNNARLDFGRLPNQGKAANRLPNWAKGKTLPHYHRRGAGGIGRHRPWQSTPSVSKWKFWERF